MQKKIMAIMLAGFLILSMTSCSKESSPSTPVQNETEETSSKVEKNETGVEVDGSIISWGNLEVDNPDLNLTEDQIEVLKYYTINSA